MKRFLVCGLSAVLLGSTVACSAAPTKEVQLDPVKVYYVNQTLAEEDPMSNWLRQSKESFEKIEGQIQLRALSADSFAGMIIKNIVSTAETAPDLVLHHKQWTSFCQDGLYEEQYADLTEYLETDPDKDDYLPNLLENITLKEKLYGIPISMSLEGLWYHKKLLREAGYPEGLTAKTWEEFFSVLENLQQKLPEVQPFWYTGIRTFPSYIAAGTNQTWIDPITMDWVLPEETVKEAMGFIERLEPFTQSLSENTQLAQNEWRQSFQQEKIAIVLQDDIFPLLFDAKGDVPLPNISEEVGFSPFPSKEGKEPVSMGTGWYFGIPELSKQKVEAYEFIRHCMSEPQYSAYVLDSGVVATRKSILQREDYLAQPFKREQAELLPFCKETFFWEGVRGKRAELGEQMDRIRNGTPAEEALNAFLG